MVTTQGHSTAELPVHIHSFITHMPAVSVASLPLPPYAMHPAVLLKLSFIFVAALSLEHSWFESSDVKRLSNL